jgi:hypothetical protein
VQHVKKCDKSYERPGTYEGNIRLLPYQEGK